MRPIDAPEITSLLQRLRIGSVGVFLFLSAFALASVSATGATNISLEMLTAAKAGNLDDVRRLIANGEDVNATSAEGVTALMVAAAANQVAVVNALLESGADARMKTASGKTAAFFASGKGNTEVASILEEAASKPPRPTKRQASLQRNQDLNDAFNAGLKALAARQFDEAVAQFNKAAEIGAKQGPVWSNLADAYVGLGDARIDAAGKQAAYDKSFEAYQKAIALNPHEAALHNNYALALVKERKIDDAQRELQTAATLDPSSAAKYYYNMGAVFTVSNQPEAAGAAFKKAIDTDPNYAEAQYQYAIYLLAKMPGPGPDGKVTAPPGLKEALEEYLQLAPKGPNASAARDLLAAIGGH